jgi:hypothetical protein
MRGRGNAISIFFCKRREVFGKWAERSSNTDSESDPDSEINGEA